VEKIKYVALHMLFLGYKLKNIFLIALLFCCCSSLLARWNENENEKLRFEWARNKKIMNCIYFINIIIELFKSWLIVHRIKCFLYPIRWIFIVCDELCFRYLFDLLGLKIILSLMMSWILLEWVRSQRGYWGTSPSFERKITSICKKKHKNPPL